MQAPENPQSYVGSAAARMIVALCVFLGAVGAAAWYLAGGSHEADKVNENKEKVAAAEAEAPGFFYKAIGQAPEAPVTAPAGDGKTSYTLELAVESSREAAEARVEGLRAKGVEAYYTPLSREGKVVFRVRRGIFPTHKEASRAAVALKKQHELSADIVKLQ